MKVKAKIQKWGNSLAIRIIGVMRDVPHFQEGTTVEVDVSLDGLQIRKIVQKHSSIFPFSEAELLKDMNPTLAHAEIIANPIKGEY